MTEQPAVAPEPARIHLIVCARCRCLIQDGGMCGYHCDLDGTLRDMREPADVVAETYELTSRRSWAEEAHPKDVEPPALFAATPDMYAALKAIIDARMVWVGAQELLANARAAIAKAEGR